jgi:hypothetical protein
MNIGREKAFANFAGCFGSGLTEMDIKNVKWIQPDLPVYV